MPTPPMDMSLGPKYIKLAATCRSRAEMAEKLGLREGTLSSRLTRLGVVKQVGNLLAGNRVKEKSDELVPKAEIPKKPTTEPDAPDIVGTTSEVHPDVERIRKEAEARFKATSGRAEQKRQQRIRFSHGPVCIFFCGDQHIGGEGTDVARIWKEQELMMDTPGGYVWLTGDGVDSYVLGRLIALNWNPGLPIYEQWMLYGQYMRNFGDRLIAYSRGNHEGFVPKAMGVDYARDVCPDGPLYDSDEIKATVHVGNKQFRILCRHKYKNTSQYNQTHGQEWWSRFSDSEPQILVGAHRHTGAVAREYVIGRNRKLAIQTGTYKIEDKFQREMGFAENDSSTAVALILNDSGTFFAMSDLEAAREYMQAVYRG